jgi:hypothetical protein
MNRASLRAVALACLIGSLAAPGLSQTVEAGSVTVTITPKGKSAKVVRKGLKVLTRVQERRNAAAIDQKGEGNSALVSQTGQGNALAVFQRGNGHSAAASQDGNNNALGVFQFGRNTSTTASQTGNGKTGIIIQGGW